MAAAVAAAVATAVATAVGDVVPVDVLNKAFSVAKKQNYGFVIIHVLLSC